jgi:hypothetical protein
MVHHDYSERHFPWDFDRNWGSLFWYMSYMMFFLSRGKGSEIFLVFFMAHLVTPTVHCIGSPGNIFPRKIKCFSVDWATRSTWIFWIIMTDFLDISGCISLCFLWIKLDLFLDMIFYVKPRFWFNFVPRWIWDVPFSGCIHWGAVPHIFVAYISPY